MVTAGAVSQRIARAEAAGLVTRAPSRMSRRAVAITLTPAGHSLIERTVHQLLSHEETLVAELGPEQRTALTSGLLALIARLS